MSLGGARQLLDVLCFGLLNNAIAIHHAAGAQLARLTDPVSEAGRLPRAA